MRLLAIFAVSLCSGCAPFKFGLSEPHRAESDVCVIHPRMCGLPSTAPALTRPVHVRITEGDHA